MSDWQYIVHLSIMWKNHYVTSIYSMILMNA